MSLDYTKDKPPKKTFWGDVKLGTITGGHVVVGLSILVISVIILIIAILIGSVFGLGLVPTEKEAIFTIFSIMIHTQVLLISIVLAILFFVMDKNADNKFIIHTPLCLFIILLFCLSIICDLFFLCAVSNKLDVGVDRILFLKQFGLITQGLIIWYIANLVLSLMFLGYYIIKATYYE